ncbi:MAG: tRNA (adenosine(37)-N6)-dimethylallyltransferase MiaA [Planctomycetota bacterium]|nr:tRNA (adenosine(37)-N6)-dimethylallyltransferase MiaA [Planctomycetota bacterium]
MARRKDIRIIIGPTASGKSKLAARVAKRLETDVISMDSMKVYRRMDIGTAKPSAKLRREVTYHMIDILEPTQTYTVADYVQDSMRIADTLHGLGKPPLFAGGTALYYKGIIEGIFEGPAVDPAVRKSLEKQADEEGVPALHSELSKVDSASGKRILENDRRRIIRALEVYRTTGQTITSLQKQFGTRREGYRFFVLGLLPEREYCYRLCEARVDRMVQEGLVEEARDLYRDRARLGRGPLQAVGYKELFEHFAGNLPLEEAIENIRTHTRQFARRQYMWFRKFEDVKWIDRLPGDTPESLEERAVNEYPEFFGL